MPSAETSPSAHARIDSLNAALEAMLQTLAAERQALDNADAEDLVAIAARKAEAVETIGTLYSALKRDLGLESDATAQANASGEFTAALVRIRKSTPQLAEGLDRLLELTRSCRLHNQDNGLLVNLGLQHCQSNLSLLQRLNQATESGTYGPGAQSEDHFDSLHRLQLRA